MLHYKFINITIGLMLIISSCTDLNVKVESELVPENFPAKAEDYEAATAGIYTKLASMYSDSYWRAQELSTDAAILPARDGNWWDGGYFIELHKHTWTPDNGIINGCWSWAYEGISLTNSALVMFEDAPESDIKTQKISQIRYMRALYHFFLMDLFGNVPILTTFGERGKTEPREAVFSFIEKELKEIADELPVEKDIKTYARPTKWAAYALLAKIYLNADVYTGKAKYNETIAACDQVIASGKFALDEDYISIFNYDNGPIGGKALDIKETIFAVWYDPIYSPGSLFSRYSLHPSMDLVGVYNLPTAFKPSNCMSTTPDFFAKYDAEKETDKRMVMWVTGKQYNKDGSPIMIKTTKGAFSYATPKEEKDEPMNWHFEIFNEMELKAGSNPELMDLGKDLKGDATGTRNIKWWPDPDMVAGNRQSHNNMPVFRYADILMMKAEAILRGGAATGGEKAVDLVNMIRRRSGLTDLPDITLDRLREERAKEFVWEGWRRNDMIRFGEFHKKWCFKYEESDRNHQIFAVPLDQMRLNADLKQNPGYPGL